MITLETIKKKSIVDVAGALGIPLKRLSSTLYEQVEHDSFKIFTNTNTFKWFSRDIQGDVIDFVQLLAGVSFKEAIHFLDKGDFPEQEVQALKLEPFRYYLPESKDFGSARTYLKTIRHLSDETINTFGRQGFLAQGQWQSDNHTEPVVVFKSKDHHGRLVGASLQGIEEHPDRYKRGRLKKIMKGSHGYAGVSLAIGKPKRLVFAESAIDLMSYYECHKEELSDVRLVSMEGLKKSVIAYHVIRLASEEKGDFSFLDELDKGRLTNYLDMILRSTTHFQTHEQLITLVVDNDKAGRDFIAKLQEQGFPVQKDLPPLDIFDGKSDWNEELIRQKQEPSLDDWLCQFYEERSHGFRPSQELALEL
ncbi:DNA primase [Streptococcus caprae]|uniref:DNA primase n=1 Tax=Streptococcus caprae TaxID=1640501 RepID=A0ABV8CXT9_9STRE